MIQTLNYNLPVQIKEIENIKVLGLCSRFFSTQALKARSIILLIKY